jgi:hypothetical protein
MSAESPNKSPVGRPPRDWDRLFSEWVATPSLGMNEFLVSKGLDPKSGSTKLKTRNWKKNIGPAREELEAGKVVEEGLKPETHMVDVSPQRMQANWDKIRTWRQGQSVSDWKTADNVRLHVSLILKGGLRVIEGDGGKKEFATSLGTRQLRDLSGVLMNVQRIQRLALGMSTENIGMEAKMQGASIGGDLSIEVDGETVDMKQVQALPPQIIITLPSNGKMAEENVRKKEQS